MISCRSPSSGNSRKSSYVSRRLGLVAVGIIWSPSIRESTRARRRSVRAPCHSETGHNRHGSTTGAAEIAFARARRRGNSCSVLLRDDDAIVGERRSSAGTMSADCMASVDTALAARLHARAGAERWALPVAAFARALERSAAKCPASADLGQYLDGLHLEDLALAAACEEGLDAAWEHFVREYRPALYRAAQAIDRSADARELADSLYAELFGVRDRGEARPSLFRYFHGRSTLATWLRSVLAQRHIDRVRAGRRFDPLPEEDEPGTLAAPVVTARSRRAAVRRAGARRIGDCDRRPPAARSAAAGLVLCAADDAGRDRSRAEGARSHGVPAPQPHAEGPARRHRAGTGVCRAQPGRHGRMLRRRRWTIRA